jgi:ribosomal protein S18 acetylase RimI-like enzyme
LTHAVTHSWRATRRRARFILEELPMKPAMKRSEPQPGTLETDAVAVRRLEARDLDAMVRIDREWTGRGRREYYQLKLAEAERDSGVRVSLAAELDGQLAGFLLARVYYGEFGRPEPVALLDTIAVSRAFAGRHVGAALIRQLRMNLDALGVDKLQTEVDWNQFSLLEFFARQGFRPAPRLCLELAIERPVE